MPASPGEPPGQGIRPDGDAPAPGLATALAAWLDEIDRPGDFCTAGACELPAPGLCVEGIGPVALPLLPVQAAQLIGIAEQAPFGRGAATVVDPTVRRTWQIPAPRVSFQGRLWPRTLEEIVARAAAGLGVEGKVTAQLHKLLLYGEGGFFREHRDTEKGAGMFGTLVIVLPSAHDGGQLLVRHGDREVAADLRPDDPAEARFAAFYADCRHEVKPVVSGYRLTLVYNLLRRGGRPEPPAYDDARDGLADLLAGWDGEEAPLKLVYPLEHAYTPEALAFEALKGADAARATVLVAAAARSDCEVHLALLTIRESGSAEHLGFYGRRRWRGEDEEGDDRFEVVEVAEHEEELSAWRRPGGGEPGLGPLPVDEGEVAPPGALDDLEPTEQSFHEATGNEGASFSRTYHAAALVVWPRRHRLALLHAGGLAATMPALAALAAACGGDRGRPEWAEAHALAGLMIGSWRSSPWRAARDTGAFLELLSTLGDTEWIESFLDGVILPGRFAGPDAEGVARALHALPPAAAVERLTRIVQGPAPLEARVAVLARCADLDIAAAAARLVASLPGPTPPADRWGRPAPMQPSVVADLVRALAARDEGLLGEAIDTFLAWPATWDPDAVLIPAVLQVGALSPRLRDACIAHLRARVALPLVPPPDSARDATLTCGCSHCAGLARFLADPGRQTWELKAPQDVRSHVEATIDNSHCDVDAVTLTRGRPYTLLCTKNLASFERRVAQRRDDLALLQRL